MARIKFLLWVEGKLTVDEEHVEPEGDTGDFAKGLFLKHLAPVIDKLYLVEIENLDEPDLNERFLRVGTDKAGMRRPIEVNPSRFSPSEN